MINFTVINISNYSYTLQFTENKIQVIEKEKREIKGKVIKEGCNNKNCTISITLSEKTFPD